MHLSLVLLTVAFGATLVVQSVLFPVFRAPDEANHVDLVRATAQAWRAGGPLLHEPDAVRPISSAVARAREQAGLHGPPGQTAPLTAASAPPPAQRPSFAELDGGPTGVRNQMTQHPPGYYLLAGLLAGPLERAGVAFDREVLLLRLLGAVLTCGLPACAWVAAGRLGADRSGRFAAALVPCAIPMLAHIGAAVNNDVLLLALLAPLTPALLRAAQPGRLPWWQPVAVGALAGAALLTKGFALVVVPWLPLAFLLGARHGDRARRLAQVGVATVVAGAVGGWWWVRNLLVVGVVQPNHTSVGPAAEGFAPDWGWWSWFAALRLMRRFWIEPDTVQQVPPWEGLAALLLVVAVAAGAARGLRGGRAGLVAVALLPAVMLLSLVLGGSAVAYLDTGRPFGLNGRYLFAALPGLAATAGLVTGTRARATVALLLAGTAALVLHAWAWSAALAFYWGAGTGAPASLRALVAWSPLPVGVLLGAALAAPLALLVALWRELHAVRTAARVPDAGTSPRDVAEAFL